MDESTKTKILEEVRSKLGAELRELEAIARKAHEAATHAELQAEGKYDTQGIEAGYLAGAQARRVEELRSDLGALLALNLSVCRSDRVSVGSIVELEAAFYFLVPAGAGAQFEFDGKRVRLLSIQSPLGRSLMGCEVGEEVEVGEGENFRMLEIRAIH